MLELLLFSMMTVREFNTEDINMKGLGLKCAHCKYWLAN